MSNKSILVTGCAGFIGSVVTEYLVNDGYNVIGVDNFQSSFRDSVHPGIKFYEGSIGDANILDSIFRNNAVELVCHLAAESVIGKAHTDPAIFYRDNVIYSMNLLDYMRWFGCKKIIMSSTGSTYGEPQYIPMDENHPQNPINAYGESKYLFERILKRCANAYELEYIIFRYYNVGGATEMNGERRKDETRLVPTALRCLQFNTPITIFGTDYNTKDGTAVRDYVHVKDIAIAHLLAIYKFYDRDANKIYNLGSETGFTVSEILDKIEEISGKKLVRIPGLRRPGDPEKLVASSAYAKSSLGWNPINSTLDKIVVDSIAWYERTNT